MLGRRRGKRIVKNSIRFGERFVDIADAEFELITYIRLFSGFDMGQIRESLGRSMLFMNQWGVLLDRLQDVKDPRQRLVIDLDQLQRILGGPVIRGRHRDDGIANVANLNSRDPLALAAAI